MTDRTLRRTADAVWRALGSRAASFWVMGAWIALAVVWVVPFQFTEQPQVTIDAILADWWPFRIVHVALLVTTLACGIARFGRDLRRSRSSLPLGRPLPDQPAVRCGGSLDEAAAALDAAGFAVTRRPDRVLGERHRWSALGGALFHLALPLLAAGFAVHAYTFGAIQFRVIEGQSMDFVSPSIASGEGRWEGLAAVTESLTVDAVEPVFYRDVLLFEKLAATVREERTGRVRRMSLSSPVWLDPFTFLSIQDFGYAPDVQLVSANGTVVEEVIGAIDVFPPGAQDKLRLPRNGYTVTMMVYPDHAVRDGRDVSLSFNLRNPKVLVGVEQDYPEGVTRARGLVGLGEAVVGADHAVRVKDIRRSGTLKVARSYGWPLVVAAAVIALAGLTSRFLFPRCDVVVWEHEDGLGMSGRVDGRPGSAARQALLGRLAEQVAKHDPLAGSPDAGGEHL